MNREEEISLIKKILSHPAGFDLGLFVALKIRSHSDGYEVAWDKAADPKSLEDEYNKDYYKDFTDLQQAVEFFVDKRYELELGLDIEAELMKDMIDD